MSLFSELKRRNVLRVAAAYVAVAWLIIQVVETIFPAFGFGDAAIRGVVIVLAIAFIPAVVPAWAFELTPEGLRKASTFFAAGVHDDRPPLLRQDRQPGISSPSRPGPSAKRSRPAMPKGCPSSVRDSTGGGALSVARPTRPASDMDVGRSPGVRTDQRIEI